LCISNANKKEAIQNTRSMIGPNMGLDHALKKEIIKQKLLTIYRKNSLQLKKWEKKQLYTTQYNLDSTTTI
jgi:hypothetical protein